MGRWQGKKPKKTTVSGLCVPGRRGLGLLFSGAPGRCLMQPCEPGSTWHSRAGVGTWLPPQRRTFRHPSSAAEEMCLLKSTSLIYTLPSQLRRAPKADGFTRSSGGLPSMPLAMLSEGCQLKVLLESHKSKKFTSLLLWVFLNLLSEYIFSHFGYLLNQTDSGDDFYKKKKKKKKQ